MTPYRLNTIVQAADGRSYMSVCIDVVTPPPGPGWAKLWTPGEPASDREH